MEDRELLNLAAKAAGVDLNKYHTFGYDNMSWNPLIDDGDALRLAVHLGLDIITKTTRQEVYVGSQDRSAKAYEYHEEDKYFAARRAIVRAAAQIGKSM